jgi:hypothetical protein
MSKLNIVRSLRNRNDFEQSNKKEANWNNRFHLGKLPAYDSYGDINCKYIFKSRFENKNIQRRNKVKTI